MKIACTVCVGNRLLPTLAISAQRRHVKSTLALCKQPKSEEYCIILFTGQNKSGAKYNLDNNISQVLTKFVNDGKATIQFKTPPHDLYIQCDPIQLKSFLKLLKQALDKRITGKNLKLSTMSVTPIATKDLVQKTLMIAKRSDYPMKGFPRTLEELYINNIKRCSLDKGILQLVKLKVLDLSNNCIEFIPEELNKLPNLANLNLSYNCLGKSSPQQWSWMGGNLSQSLIILSLESNKLTFLPDQIVKLYKLNELYVANNELTVLPPGLGNLRNLKKLFAAYNHLTLLPGTARQFQLTFLDIYHNDFENRSSPPCTTPIKTLSVCSLKESAGRRILNLKIPYSGETIPASLVYYLDHAKYCVCGKACFDVYVRVPETLILTNIAQTFAGSSTVPIDSYFCTLKCFQSSHFVRSRYPVI